MFISKSTRYSARAVGIVSMMIGASLAVISFSFLNIPLKDKEIKSTKQSISFEVKQALVKPKMVPKRKKPKSKPSKKMAPPAVALDLGLSGIDIGLMAFKANEFSDVDESLLGDMNNVVMTSDMVDVVPSIKFKSTMEYPARAKAKEIEGFVTLSLLINESGKIETVKIIESEPAGVFDNSVLRTIKQWKFEPARYKGQPVKTWANQTLRFELG